MGRRTGVGRYVDGLTRALSPIATTAGDRLALTAFTLRGGGALPALTPPGVAVHSRPVPARLLRGLWSRAEWPPVGLLSGATDVFHATNFVLPPTGRARGVLTVHDLTYLHHRDAVDPTSAAYRELVPRSLRRVAQVVVPSAAVAAELQEAYQLPADRVTVTPLGVGASWSTAAPPDAALRTRLGIPPHYLLAVGTIEPRKGLPRLLTAYRAVRAERSDVPPLLLVGPAGWGAQLDLTGLPEGAVVFTGYLDDGALQRTVAGARALVFPSRYEGFGLPPLEALACGVPVVATDLPVTREVLADQARFVATDEELAAALGEATDGTLPGDQRSRQARAQVFTWARCAALTREVYARAIS
ncbi:glycosyltransferase family 4 protein [Modestobacter italicus]|uniref:glycosyltransferase family 4 protein n=1 Tax=Modestobacter italicus (strain DSM 44449 / CECT 9708 / BC 501) TaxID=2732864 RepID=UPI001C956C34|nr:glycosyltransferase family 1 protein [Modestobacter italicus]